MNPSPRDSVCRSGRQHGGQGSCQCLARKDLQSQVGSRAEVPSPAGQRLQQARASSGWCQGRSVWHGAALWCVELSCLSSGLEPVSVRSWKLCIPPFWVFSINVLAPLMPCVQFAQEPIYGVLQPVKARQVHSRFGQMEENLRSCGNAGHDFIQGWGDPRMPQAVCHTAGSPNSLIYYMYTKLAGCQNTV